MPRRVTLTDRQREALLCLPVDQGELLRHYTLSDEDLGHIRQRRRAHNRFGFALQLCALRYPGRVLAPGEVIPVPVTDFIAAQLGLSGDDLLLYAAREETRHEHLADLRRIYGYRSFTGRGARDLREWITREAETATSNEDLARSFIAECRRARTILPASSTIERLCADALVDAERRIENRIAGRVTPALAEQLGGLLEDTVDGRVTRFVWLRQFEVGANSRAANRLLDRLEYLQRLDLPENLLAGVPAHRVGRLRRQGERYYADGMRDLPENRRIAILAVCALEWRMSLADVVVETHDRIVGRLYRASERLCSTRIADEKAAVQDTLKSFAEIGGALIGAQDDGAALDGIIAAGPGWERFKSLVATASALTNVLAADPLSRVLDGYHRFRLYTPRMLRLLDMQAAPVAAPLLAAIAILRRGIKAEPPINYLRPNSKWHRHLRGAPVGDYRLWEIAVLFHIRDAFRSGDIWLAGSRRYGDLKQILVPAQAIEQTARLAVPLRPGEWIAERRARVDARLKELGRAARAGTIPGGIIENGTLHIDRLKADIPEGAEDLVLDLYQQLPPAKITDLLLEVDERTGFSEAFTHLRTGAPCVDRIGLMNVLLAEGVNLGLRKMAAATNTHSFWELLRIARWHVEGSAYDRALAMIVEAHAALPMAAFWGEGYSASSDGQFFLATEQGEAMNMINAKYGNVPGLKGYSHVSDQYAPFATQVIPATVSEAPYILDGLLMNDAGRRVRQHFADTGGFTDHVFAACSLLGYRFAPRIRDLPQKRLYAFNPGATPANVRGLVGGKINEPLIERNWPDILRVTATIAAGIVAPSQILRKLASYPRQNELALALREVGRIERTLFMIDWILDASLQRQAQIGLNKGEAHHALKRAISFHRRGEIRDRSGEGQHYRIAGMNLLAAIIIFWNTMKLGEVVNSRAVGGTAIPPDLLAYVSPLGWEHINLTGEYRWPKSLAKDFAPSRKRPQIGMFRRSETTRTVGLSLAGPLAAVLIAAAGPARPPAAPPTALSADVAPCEAVAVRARDLGDARWSAEGTGAVEALVDIVPEAPASAVPEAQVAGDPAVRAALGLGSRDTPVEVRRLPGAEVYEVSQVAGSAACQSLVFARRTPGKPVTILPSPTLQGEMCSGGYAHVGRAGGQPALIQIQRSAASPSEAAASRKPLVEIRVTPWTGAGWGRTCKVGLAFRAERKLVDRLCARPADCKAFEPTAVSLASAFNRGKAQVALNRRAPTPVRYFPEGPPKGSEAALAQVKAYMAKAQRPLPLFGATPTTSVMPGYSEDELDFVPVRIDGRAYVATVGFPGIGWRQDRSATLVTLFETGKTVTPRATYILSDAVSGLESAKVELARD